MRCCCLIFILLCLLSADLLAQQMKIQVFEGDSTRIHPLIYKRLDSLEQQKLTAYYAADTTQIAFVKNFFYGKQSGIFKSYYPDGSLMELSIYQNGKRNGDYTRYNREGEVVIKARYKEGKLHGFWIDREKQIQGRYRNGLRHGKWEFYKHTAAYIKRYYKHGKLIDDPSFFSFINFDFLKGNGSRSTDSIPEGMGNQLQKKAVPEPKIDSLTIKSTQGIKQYQIRYLSRDSISHPTMRKAVFSHKPKQVAVVKYIYQGKLNGLYQEFFPNGNTYRYANYSYGVLHGKWREYDETGKLIIKGNYRDGEKHGSWHYFPDTKKHYKEKYRRGEKKK